MKRSMFLLASIISTMLMSANDNVTLNVTGKNMTINLENQTAYCGFQMDFELPAGMSIASVKKGMRLVTEEGSMAPFVVDFDKIEGNTYRIVVLNDDCQAIEGETGDLLTVEFSASVTAQLEATNIHFVKASNLRDVKLEDAASDIAEGPAVIIGDANGDGIVNVQDYVGVAKYILQGDFAGFNFVAADTNHDGEINVQDYLSVAKIILDGGANSQHRMPAENVNTENDYLVGEVASDGQLCIGLNNEAQYTMFQMDVALPEGAVLLGVEGTDRMKASHTIEWCKQEGNVWRILVGTTSLAAFRGNAGDLLTLEVNGMDEDFATIENCLFVTPENILKRMADLTIGAVTGISGITSSEATTIYNLQGQRVANSKNLPSGVYINNGKKVIIK